MRKGEKTWDNVLAKFLTERYQSWLFCEEAVGQECTAIVSAPEEEKELTGPHPARPFRPKYTSALRTLM